METRQGQKTKGRTGAKEASQTKVRGAKRRKDTNRKRREKYSNDSGYREQVKQRSRQAYRKENPKHGSPLVAGLLSEATEREVHTGDGSIFIEECYTLGEAATALGKSRLTLKRWVEDELVPPPILMDTAYQYRQYSRRELQLIAQHLALHEAEHSYLHQGHTETINGMWQSVEAHRRSHVGE